MKKILLGIGLLFTSLFMFSGEANAATELCKYKGNFGSGINTYTAYVRVYYDVESNDFSINLQTYTTGGWSKIFQGGDKNFTWSIYEKKRVYMSNPAVDAMKVGECPKNVYYDPDGTKSVCLDANDFPSKGYCQKNEGYEAHELLQKEFDVYAGHEADNIFAAHAITFDDVECSEVKTEADALAILNSKISIVIQNAAAGMPEGYINKIYESTKEKYTTAVYNYGYADFKNRCGLVIEEQKESGTITEEEANKQAENFEISLDTVKGALDYDYFVDLFDRNYLGKLYCGFIGEKTFGYLEMIYSLIKFLIPASIILLGMTDFLKVLFSGEDKDMKQAWTSFIKRIIAGVVFILLPVLIEFILFLVGFSENCLQQLIT